MKVIFLILLLSSISVDAKVISGEKIKAIEYNNSIFTIGDIKHSILTLSEFQTLHGSCWIKYNQGSDESLIDISDSDLSDLKVVNFIKSATGRTLRAEGGNSAALGNIQNDALEEHEHNLNVGSVTASSGNSGNNAILMHSVVGSTKIASGVYNYASGIRPGANSSNETRMKNITVNMFIKINHSCN